MGGRSSREKGARSERAVAAELTAGGFPSTRNARNGLSVEDIDHSIPGVHLEAKHCENISMPAWLRQAERDAGPDRIPAVVFRQSRQPWRIVIPLSYYLELERTKRDYDKHLC